MDEGRFSKQASSRPSAFRPRFARPIGGEGGLRSLRLRHPGGGGFDRPARDTGQAKWMKTAFPSKLRRGLRLSGPASRGRSAEREDCARCARAILEREDCARCARAILEGEDCARCARAILEGEDCARCARVIPEGEDCARCARAIPEGEASTLRPLCGL
jgi:hypothetical protein